VVIEGFDIDGLAGGDLGADSSGVHVAAPGAVIRGCRISNALFGILHSLWRARLPGLRPHQRLARPARGAGRSARLAPHGLLALAPERGTAELLFSQPISRQTILVGKLLGLFGALAAAEFVGFGLAGLAVFSSTSEEGGGRDTRSSSSVRCCSPPSSSPSPHSSPPAQSGASGPGRWRSPCLTREAY
jgi:hypothetical protein